MLLYIRTCELHSQRLVTAEQSLIESIQMTGILVPLIVSQDYRVMDGEKRLSAAREIGLETVPCQVFSPELVSEIMAPKLRVRAKPIEYARQLQRILRDMTVTDLTTKIGKAVPWIMKQLTLLSLVPQAQELVDSGEISRDNGVLLAILPKETQENHLNAARMLSYREFATYVARNL